MRDRPEGYEEIGCTETELDSNNINQCCEKSGTGFGCANCGACAGHNTAVNPASPGQTLNRVNANNETCCTHQEGVGGVFYFRNGTEVPSSECPEAPVYCPGVTTGDPSCCGCKGRNDTVCCKVGNGATQQDFACFDKTDVDSSVPYGVPNDDNCVCALLSILRNPTNDGSQDWSRLSDYCKAGAPSFSPSISSAPSKSAAPSGCRCSNPDYDKKVTCERCTSCYWDNPPGSTGGSCKVKPPPSRKLQKTNFKSSLEVDSSSSTHLVKKSIWIWASMLMWYVWA